jgi:hypothetical protein
VSSETKVKLRWKEGETLNSSYLNSSAFSYLRLRLPRFHSRTVNPVQCIPACLDVGPSCLCTIACKHEHVHSPVIAVSPIDKKPELATVNALLN